MEGKVRTKDLKQTAKFACSPHEIYEMLMDAEKHAQFTGSGAKISRKVGGKFETYDGWAYGKNVELVKDRRIVQLWRGDDWPEGHYSTVTFKLSKSGNGTKLEFTQKGIPVQFYKDISEGWKEYYWKAMKEHLEA
ncbi:MAG: SRPBCC domain-containing protein [Candidatus Micrarchaeota archaeon]|nr:SRPBCC domain-containing protein [Candidatus Micrarchaeota archaeon]